MPILFEELTFAPARVKDSERVLTIELAVVFVCPVCGAEFPTEEAMIEHLKTEHPLHYWFWYWKYDTIPAGKILLGGTIAIPTIAILAALARKKK